MFAAALDIPFSCNYGQKGLIFCGVRDRLNGNMGVKVNFTVRNLEGKFKVLLCRYNWPMQADGGMSRYSWDHYNCGTR